MTIRDIRFTASPAYAIHALCVSLGIPYSRLSDTGHTRKAVNRGTFVPNHLGYIDSVALLADNWDAISTSESNWSLVVHASETEASELNFPYASVAHRDWLFQGLVAIQFIDKLPKKNSKNANATYLSSVITELYKIKPKEARPFLEVFRYLSGVTAKPNVDAYPKLGLAVKAALPIRRAIRSLGKDQSLPNRRKVAKELRIDLFEINYTLAKGKVKSLDDED